MVSYTQEFEADAADASPFKPFTIDIQRSGSNLCFTLLEVVPDLGVPQKTGSVSVATSEIVGISRSLISANTNYRSKLLGNRAQYLRWIDELVLTGSTAFKSFIDMLNEADQRNGAEGFGNRLKRLLLQRKRFAGSHIYISGDSFYVPFELFYVPDLKNKTPGNSGTLPSKKAAKRNRIARHQQGDQSDYCFKNFLGARYNFYYLFKHCPVQRQGKAKALTLFQHDELDTEDKEKNAITAASRKLRLRLEVPAGMTTSGEVISFWSRGNVLCHFSCHHEIENGNSTLRLSELLSFDPVNLRTLPKDCPKPVVFLNTCEGANIPVDFDTTVSMIKKFPKYTYCLIAPCAVVTDEFASKFAAAFYHYLGTPISPGAVKLHAALFDARQSFWRNNVLESDPDHPQGLLYGLFFATSSSVLPASISRPVVGDEPF